MPGPVPSERRKSAKGQKPQTKSRRKELVGIAAEKPASAEIGKKVKRIHKHHDQ
jgi:hypothetical protein